MLDTLAEDKKKQKQKRPQNRAHNQKASGLVNANHFFETSEELANRQQDAQRKAQSGTQQQPGKKNPEGPG